VQLGLAAFVREGNPFGSFSLLVTTRPTAMIFVNALTRFEKCAFDVGGPLSGDRDLAHHLTTAALSQFYYSEIRPLINMVQVNRPRSVSSVVDSSALERLSYGVQSAGNPRCYEAKK
jgi:hypothetical protein